MPSLGGWVAKPFVISPLVRMEITFTGPSYGDGVTNLPFVERIDGRAIAFTSDDFIKAFESFNAIQFFTIVVR
jgi:D-aminopeptidase